MANIQDDIDTINYELSRIQRNKATEHYIGQLNARMARIRERQAGSGGGGKGMVYNVKKQGDATVDLVGFPSVGKSSLLNVLTSAQSKVAAYEFTTLKPVPGMLFYKKAKIQLIDAPGIIEGASIGKGLGRQIISAFRTADLLLILIEPRLEQLGIILKELYDTGVRLDTEPPNVLIKRTDRGGIIIDSTVKQELDEQTFKDILNEWSYSNAYVVLRERLSMDRFIDALTKNRVYIPSLLAVNKSDRLNAKELNEMKRKYPKAIFVSAELKKGLEELKEAIWHTLQFKRVYMKRPGLEPDMNEPLIMRGTITIESIAAKLKKKASSAKVWGRSVKHAGQIVGIHHVLADEDIVTIDED